MLSAEERGNLFLEGASALPSLQISPDVQSRAPEVHSGAEDVP